jgi:hypothetical protein
MLMATAAALVRHFALWSGLVWSGLHKSVARNSVPRLLHSRAGQLIRHGAAHCPFLQDCMMNTQWTWHNLAAFRSKRLIHGSVGGSCKADADALPN